MIQGFIPFNIFGNSGATFGCSGISTPFFGGLNPFVCPSPMPMFSMPMIPMMPMMPMPAMPMPFGSIFGFNGAGGSSSFSSSVSSSETRSQGYNSNALKNLRNASIFKGISEERKTAILDIVDRAAKKHNVDPKLILSIMYHESRFDPKATSTYKTKNGVGHARGLMQLIDANARRYGASDPYDMEQNIFAGTKMIAELSKKYNGNISLIAAAYNAGPARVKNSVPEIKETKNYVARVNSTYKSLG